MDLRNDSDDSSSEDEDANNNNSDESGEDNDDDNNNNNDKNESKDDSEEETILEFIRACATVSKNKSSDMSEVQKLLDNGVSIDSRGYQKTTALMIACMFDNMDLAKFLLDRKCDMNLRNNDNLDALGLACQYRRIDAIKLLIQYGADINVVYGTSGDKMPVTPMTLAMKDKNSQIMNLLLDSGCNYEFTKDFTEKLYLHKLVDLLRPLAAHNIHDCKRHVFMLVSFTSCKSGDIESVREQLVSNRDLVNAIDPESNDTLAHIACRINNIQMLLVLIEFGADLDLVNGNNETIATVGRIFGSSDIQKVLAEKTCKDGKDMLFFNDSFDALMKDDIGNFKILLDTNRHIVNTIDPKTKDSLIHITCRYNKVDALLLLLTYNANIDLFNSNNETAAMIAYSVSSLTCLEILANKDAVESKALYKLASSTVYHVLHGGFMTQDYNSWKVPSFNLKYFVSSTFTDTHDERNIIMAKLLPELQTIARPQGIAVTFVDMRWGVRDENTDDHKTWDACKIELERCKIESYKTFFISLQSYKYGYRPLPRVIAQDTFDNHVNNYIGSDKDELIKIAKSWYVLDSNAIPPTYMLTALDANNREEYWDDNKKNIPRVLGKLLKLLDGLEFENGLYVGDSVTNWEAIAAFQGDNDERILWMNRNIVDPITVTIDPWKEYNDVEGSPDLTNRYRKLIDMMEKKLDTIHRIEKTSIRSLVSLKDKSDEYHIYTSEFHGKLSTVLVSELKEAIQMKEDWLSSAYDSGLRGDTCEDILHHYAWARLKVEAFSGREELIESTLRRLSEKTEDCRSGISLCVIGRSGCGKTSFMAKLASLLYNKSGIPVIIRFCGTSGNSSDGVSLLKSMIKQIHYINHLNEVIAEEYTELVKVLHTLLARYPTILLIDSIDQLSNRDLERSKLSFLRGVKPHQESLIIVSCLPDEINPSTQAYWYGCDTTLKSWEVPRLEMIVDGRDAESILDSYMSKNQRGLSTSQRQLCLDSLRREPSALYATLVARTACSWKSTLTSSSCILAPTTTLLINQIFDEIQRNYGKNLVKAVIAFITLAVDGITSTEMEDLLSLEDDVMIEVNKYNQSNRLPSHVWLRIKNEISGLVVESGQGCIRWYHRQFIETAYARYDENDKIHYYQIMGKYFSNIIDDASISKKGISKQNLLLKEGNILKPVRFRSSQPYINKRRCTEGCSNLLKGKLLDAAIDEICQPDLVYGFIICGIGFKLITYLMDILSNATLKQSNPEKYVRAEDYMIWLQKSMTTIDCNIDFLVKSAFDLPEVSCARRDIEGMISSSAASAISIDSINHGDDVWVKMRTISNKSIDKCLMNLVGHDSSISCLCYSTDGLRIATADSDSIKIWDALSGEVIHTLQKKSYSENHKREVQNLHFSRDGSRLVAQMYEFNDYPITVWDSYSGVVVFELENARQSERAYSYCAVTDRFALTSFREIKLFNIETCEQALKLRTGASRPTVDRLFYSKDGTRIVATTDAEIEIWSTISGDCTHTLSCKWIDNVCFSNDGTKVFYRSENSLCSLNIVSGEVVSNVLLTDHINGMRKFSFSQSGLLIVSEGYRNNSVDNDSDIKLWDSVSGSCIQTFFVKASNGCDQMEFTQDGSKLIIVYDSNLRIWSTRTFESLYIIGSAWSIGNVCISSDGSRMAIVEKYSSDVKIFESSSLKSDCVYSAKCHTVRVTCASCSSSGTVVATGSLNGTIKLWDSSWNSIHTLDAHTLKVVSVNFDSSDTRLCSASIDNIISIWNCATGDCEFTLAAFCESSSDSEASLLSAYFSCDGTVVTVYTNGFVKTWDQSGNCLQVFDHGNIYHQQSLTDTVERVRSTCFNRKKSLLACSDNRYINIWSTVTSECIKTLDSKFRGYGFCHGRQPICFNIEGSKLIAGSVNFIISFDVTTGEVIKYRCVLDPGKKDGDYEDLAEEYRVKSICFSADESTIVVGVYNIITIVSSTNLAVLYTLQGHTVGVEAVCSMSQHRVVSAFSDGTVKLWNISKISDVSGDYSIKSVCCNYANDFVAAVCESKIPHYHIWDIAKVQEVYKIQDFGTDTLDGDEVLELNCTCYSNDGSRIAGGCNNLIKIWSASDAKCLLTLKGHSENGEVCAVRYSYDDSKIVSVSKYTYEVKLWCVSSGECLYTIVEDEIPYKAGSPISFTPDGSKLVWISGLTNSSDDDSDNGDDGETISIKILSLETYEFTNTLRSVGKVASICCSNDVVVAGSVEESSNLRNSFFKVFSISSGECIFEYIEKKFHRYYRQIHLAISPSGKRIITSLDKTIKIWKTDGECVYTLRPFTDDLESLNCSYDASKLICVGNGDIVTYEFYK